MYAHDEPELISKAVRGDTEAYSTLLSIHSNSVYGIALSYLRDHHLAQDLAQETFVKAWFNLQHLKEQSKFRSWLYMIAKRLCLDWVRKNGHVETVELQPELAVGESPEAALYRRDTMDRVQKAINQLEETKRSVATLFFINDFTAREISEKLNLSVSAVESRIRRSKQKLKEELIDMTEETKEVQTVDGNFNEQVLWRIVPRIATVEIPVSNLKRSMEWYTQTFGLKIISEQSYSAMLQVQGGAAAGAPGIFLVETEAEQRLSFLNSHTGVVHSVIDFFVPDLKRFHMFLSDQKLEVTPINLVPGMDQGGFGVKDPDGNSLGVTNVTLP